MKSMLASGSGSSSFSNAARYGCKTPQNCSTSREVQIGSRNCFRQSEIAIDRFSIQAGRSDQAGRSELLFHVDILYTECSKGHVWNSRSRVLAHFALSICLQMMSFLVQPDIGFTSRLPDEVSRYVCIVTRRRQQIQHRRKMESSIGASMRNFPARRVPFDLRLFKEEFCSQVYIR